MTPPLWLDGMGPRPTSDATASILLPMVLCLVSTIRLKLLGSSLHSYGAFLSSLHAHTYSFTMIFIWFTSYKMSFGSMLSLVLEPPNFFIHSVWWMVSYIR